MTVEFGGNPQAMADEILRLRYGLAQLAETIKWMKLGAPFVMMPPGTGNRNRRRLMTTPNLSEAERARRSEYARESKAACARGDHLFCIVRHCLEAD